MILKLIAGGFLLAIVCVIIAGVVLNRTPRAIGIRDGRLNPCPGTPNCVSSYSSDPVHAIAPFPLPLHLQGSPIDLLAELIKTYPKTTLITKTDTYLHAEFRSKLFSFTDDVEFLVDPANNIIHVRSASRLGYSDLGVNRARVESLRRSFLISSDK